MIGLARQRSKSMGSGISPSVIELAHSDVEEQVLSLYGRQEVALSGPQEFLRAVSSYFWPQVDHGVVGVAAPWVHLVVGRILPEFLRDRPRERITLYRPSQGRVADFNEGFRYPGTGDADTFVVNPHTGTCFSVVGNQVWVIQPDLELGVRDALRVVKQVVITALEGQGVVTLHASAFTFGAGAIAVIGPKGAGKTTTALAAVATGARFVTNDRLYVKPASGTTEVWGWTDPIRLIDVPGFPKRVVPLATFFGGDARRLAVDALPLQVVVLPEVVEGQATVTCVEAESAVGEATVEKELLPPRARWLGFEPPPVCPPVVFGAERYLRLTYPFSEARRAVELLTEVVR